MGKEDDQDRGFHGECFMISCFLMVKLQSGLWITSDIQSYPIQSEELGENWPRSRYWIGRGPSRGITLRKQQPGF